MSTAARVYLDHAATTPVAPEVLAAMLPYFTERAGNAASRSHAFGWEAADAVEVAAGQLASLLGCAPAELTFTSGSTEALNLAIKGVAERYAARGRHIVTTATEHRAVLDTCAALERVGYEVTYLPPEADGRVAPGAFAEAVRDDTVLVAFLWGNNETGVLQDARAIAELCRGREVLCLADATQVVGKLPVDLDAVPLDLLACSAHKFYGPKGIGALYVRADNHRARLAPQVHGGGHQGGLRSGTLNVPGIVGFGAAAELAAADLAAESARLSGLRDSFEATLAGRLAHVVVNGGAAPRLPHISNVAIRFVEAEALLTASARQLAVSTGSACSSADLEPSHVLMAMGLSREDAKAAVRVSLGRATSAADLTRAVDLLASAAEALRGESPHYELFVGGLI